MSLTFVSFASLVLLCTTAQLPLPVPFSLAPENASRPRSSYGVGSSSKQLARRPDMRISGNQTSFPLPFRVALSHGPLTIFDGLSRALFFTSYITTCSWGKTHNITSSYHLSPDPYTHFTVLALLPLPRNHTLPCPHTLSVVSRSPPALVLYITCLPVLQLPKPSQPSSPLEPSIP